MHRKSLLVAGAALATAATGLGSPTAAYLASFKA